MKFDDYLAQKNINAVFFRQQEPETYEQWKHIFEQIHPESFTAQKKFLLNDIRRKYQLR